MPTLKTKVKLVSNPLAELSATKVKKSLKSSLSVAAKQFLKEVEEGFNSERTPGGENWEALSPDYQKFKSRAFGGKKILERKGDLKKAALSPKIEYGQPQGDSGGDGGKETVAWQAVMSVIDPTNVASFQEFGTPTDPARPFFQVLGQATDAVVKAGATSFDKDMFGN